MPKVKIENKEVSYEVYFMDIRWGEEPDETEEPYHYTFETQAELNAFQRGIDEAMGWADFEVVNEGTCFERYQGTIAAALRENQK
tara:strand:- start:1867 stop:2121 length:255 start_codon:yes stop_codon:yes gene_type:complete